jgi:type IV secretory pathway ATPase VirB11/archaellum biosynthesis ATPase
MKKYYKLIGILSLFMFFSITTLHGQNPEKMRERLKAYKKIMLMEKLNMNEEQSIKFFSRNAEHEEFIKKAKIELDQAVDMLEQGVVSGKAENDKAIQLVFEKDIALKKVIIERIKAMKNVLSEKQYGKYVVIEYKLLDDVKKAIKNRRK